MSKDTETLKERIIALVDERDKPYVIPLLNDLENAIHEHSFDNGYDDGVEMIKYKLYTHSGVTYVVPIDKYEYIDDIAGLLTTHELDSFVNEVVLDNGGKYFDIWCDDYYVIMNKGGSDDVLEIPLIGERKTTSGLENCSMWWG